MSRKTDARDKTFFKGPKAYSAWLNGRSFVAHTAALLSSAAWQQRSLYARRLTDLLEQEHLRHNGFENGHLVLTHRQMQRGGVHPRKVAETIGELEALGLVTVTHRGSYRGGARNNPSKYRLNYLPWKFIPATGAPVYYVPGDEWANFLPPEKTGRIHPATDATRIHPVDASKPEPDNTNAADSAESTERRNASTVYRHLSKLRSRGEGGRGAGGGFSGSSLPHDDVKGTVQKQVSVIPTLPQLPTARSVSEPPVAPTTTSIPRRRSR